MSSRKKRLAWRPVKLVYDQLRKTVKQEIGKEEFDSICHEISVHQAVVHVLMSRLCNDIEIINDDMKHLQAGNDDCITAYNNALKWINTSIDLVETGLEEKDKNAFSKDFEAFDSAIDWFFGPHVVEMSESKRLDIKYRSRFAGRKPYPTIEENRAFEDGYCLGSENELDEKTTISIVDGNGKKMIVEQNDLVAWFENYCNKNGIPSDLKYCVEERQVS